MSGSEYGVSGQWMVTLNLEASPENLPFEVAFAYLKHGRRIRRMQWIHAWIDVDQEGLPQFHRGYDDIVVPIHFDSPAAMRSMMKGKWAVIPA